MQRPALTRSLAIGATIIGLSVTPVAAEDAASEVPTGTPIEDAERFCVNTYQIKQTDVLDDRTILFELRNGDTLRNDLSFRCPGLGFEEGFSYATSIAKLCSNKEIIRVLRRGSSCGLGTFTTRYESIQDARAAYEAEQAEKEKAAMEDEEADQG